MPHEETLPVELVNGPLDGTAVDVVLSRDEIHRMTVSGKTAVYVRVARSRFAFSKYLEKQKEDSDA